MPIGASYLFTISRSYKKLARAVTKYPGSMVKKILSFEASEYIYNN